MKVLNLNQEFPDARPMGCPMQGARAARCLPAALALSGRFAVSSRDIAFTHEQQF
jgi:hypothetical protein